MTVARYGRITPLQGTMLSLGGELLSRGVVPQQPGERGDEQRLEGMRRARRRLVRQTGMDHGWELAAWHEALLASEEHRGGYTHSYAWRAVRRGILALINDPERRRLVGLLEDEDATC